MALIAVIDDDPDILEATSFILRSKGYEVATANNPDDGYTLIKTKQPELIILDVIMNEPDDGFFLAQRLRRENIQTPIVMYTSISKTLGMKFGPGEVVPVNAFVEKPVAPDVLLAKIDELLLKEVK